MCKKHSLIMLLLLICTLVITSCTNISQQNNKSNIAVQNETGSDNGSLHEANTATATGQETEDSENMPQVISGAFAIRNIETKKNIRPLNAGTSDGNHIILYPHHEWKCLTWQFNYIEGTAYQLQNLYTEKTFEPVSTPKEGVALWQQPRNEDSPQWEFIEQQDGVYMIRLKDTELYITISSNETDTSIVLMSDQNANTQQWELIEQYPLF